MIIDYLEPWVNVGPYADILVKELRREVVNGHPLWEKEIRAIAKRADTDDVLFRVEDATPSYAVVHLTWSGEPEIDPAYPDTELYVTLEQWVRERMIVDHQVFISRD